MYYGYVNTERRTPFPHIHGLVQQERTGLSRFQPESKVKGLSKERGVRSSLAVLATGAFVGKNLWPQNRVDGELVDAPKATIDNNPMFAAMEKFVRFPMSDRAERQGEVYVAKICSRSVTMECRVWMGRDRSGREEARVTTKVCLRFTYYIHDGARPHAGRRKDWNAACTFVTVTYTARCSPLDS